MQDVKKRFHRALFIFRRDFRLEDNSGLIYALSHSESVIPIFIFTPEQIDKNPYRSNHCLQFMIESLQDLEVQLDKKGGKLFFFYGKNEEVVEKCIQELKIDAVIVNRDYTPYSIQRDKKIEAVCRDHKIEFHSFDDALLHPPETTLKKDGTPYHIFTPYFRNASKLEVRLPISNPYENYFSGKIAFSEKEPLITLNTRTLIKGGRSEALKILSNLSSYVDYERLRDFPAEDYSTQLSPYLKFTVCSPREVYAAICQELHEVHGLIRALYWRDFFTTVAFFYPHVFKGAFRPKYDQIKWSQDKVAFQRWCEGRTGVPLVDAGMREMNETGFMHNRVRMVAASYLVKDLKIDWRWGERYFAQTLIDYDPAVNNGNWQWVAGTGADAMPIFRTFNPLRQQKKFDPEFLYIKKWVHEL